jgi:hypothetical protein
MEWIDEPPCTSLSLLQNDPKAGRLVLGGPTPGDRVKGGLVAAFGAAFAATTIPFLRLRRRFPIPLPPVFTVVPLAFLGIGGAIGALGAGLAGASVTLIAERSLGITLRWGFFGVGMRERVIDTRAIEAFELQSRSHSSGEGIDERTDVTWRLMLVTVDGVAIALERFGTRTQARLRKKALEDLFDLGGGKVLPGKAA